MTEKIELRANQWKSDGPKDDVFKLFEVESLEDVEISTPVNTETGEILWKALKERKLVEIRISDKETDYCLGMIHCPYWPECADPHRCLLDEEAKDIMKEEGMTEKIELRARLWKGGPYCDSKPLYCKDDVFKLYEVESHKEVEICTLINTETAEILWKALKERKIVEISISDKEVDE